MATWPSRRSLTSSPAGTPRASCVALVAGAQGRARAPAVARRAARRSATSASTSPTASIADYEQVVDRSTSTSIAAPRARHPPRRQGADRGVQRPRRARARAQGHDQPRPHRERRAAADPRLARCWSGTAPWRSLARLARLAAEHVDLVIAGRSHNVAAQATTLGKRFATAAEELLVAYARLEDLRRAATRCAASRARSARLRTCSTCSTATPAKLAELEQRVAEHLGFATGARPASARSTRARWTSTSSARSSSSPPARRAWR